MTSWMKQLARHYESARETHPEEDLMIVFDIDNTIIDMREMIAYVLRLYDREQGTSFFADLRPGDLTINENQVDQYLAQRGFDDAVQRDVLAWYLDKRWTTEAVMRSHRPFRGVMEVIRWFQMQPRTHVGLNTGRPEPIRRDTLRSLNSLGRRYKVVFRDDLLHMYPGEENGPVTQSKADGILAFREAGFHVFAVVDNEPDNLEAVSRVDPTGEILPVHADTIFDSKRSRLPSSTVSGSDYDLTELITEEKLPGHVQFVWHGVNDEANLRQFIGSDVQWGECDVRFDAAGADVVLRHDGFTRRPMRDGETLLRLKDVLPQLARARKSIKVDLKEGGALVDEVIDILRAFGVEDRSLWVNGSTQDLDRSVFERFAREFPGAVIQCPIGFMAPLVVISPSLARDRLEEFRSQGINRFSIDWKIRELPEILDQMDAWGYEVNVYNVPDLESFLQAVLLQPTSVTSDFNFPQWYYFGRGPGENMHHHAYALARDDDR